MTTATIKIVISSQYGTLSRGRHSARIGSSSDVIWAAKDGKGNLVIDRPGEWQLHCSDGFRRSARAVLKVKPNGDWKMTGDASRFDVIAD